jgi:hypothetical protein
VGQATSVGWLEKKNVAQWLLTGGDWEPVYWLSTKGRYFSMQTQTRTYLKNDLISLCYVIEQKWELGHASSDELLGVLFKCKPLFFSNF